MAHERIFFIIGYVCRLSPFTASPYFLVLSTHLVPLLATLLAIRGVGTWPFIDLVFFCVYLFFITWVWFPDGIIEVMAMKM